jgi:L-Ala-D/L-Glu epimerase / N-acetyl-D-glutamate racemase
MFSAVVSLDLHPLMDLTIYEFDLKLRNTFKTAHSQRDVQKSIIVGLSEEGFTGYGEVTENTYFGITGGVILQDLNKAGKLLKDYKLSTPEALHEYISQTTGIASFPLCAIDEAAYDLFGKMHNQPTTTYLGCDPKEAPFTDYTIGIASIEDMVAKMTAMPWPVYKIKLGTKEDIAIIKELREHTEATIRIDANCGWTVEETIGNSIALKELGVEFIEQPLDPDDWQGMKKVYSRTQLPVIADESCLIESDVAKCASYFHGINIKLTKCGGMTPARRMIEHARSLGMMIMAGCMTESSVGISAVAQLAPLLDYIDADGTLLISNDPATGVTFNAGKIIYPDLPGNGVHLKPIID